VKLAAELDSGGVALRRLSVALVASGRINVYSGPDVAVTLGAGSLVVCRSPHPTRISSRVEWKAEVILFECPMRWLAAALLLANASKSITERHSTLLESNRPEAIEIGRKLRHAWLAAELGSPSEHALADVHRWLDLAGDALGASGAPLDSEPSIPGCGARRITSHAVLPTLVELIANNDGLPPSLQQLATKLGLSERQTSRLFRHQMGVSFREYTSRLRVEHAMRLLEETTRTVTQVALSSGWNSLSQFNSAFRKHTGSTPGAFRSERQKSSEYLIENE